MRHPDRWVTGWVVLPSAPPLAHRPDPDDPALFMCRLVVDAETTLQPARPAATHECGRCTLAIGRARKKSRKDARRWTVREALPRQRTANAADPEQVDRHGPARERGASIRTVSGDPPTLGRQH
jgi:hypothetical protein